MSRKRNEKKKRRLRNEAQRLTGKTRVDERFQYGPLELVRAGKYVMMRNNATSEQHAEILKRAAQANKELLKQLDAKVQELQKMISKFDPLDLMHRAGYMALTLLIKGKTESELTSDETKILPSIEYLQYLIARTPGDSKAEEPTDKEWKELWEGVVDVLITTSSYLSTRAPKGKNSAEIESLIHSLDLMRLMVRVNRYPNFLEEYWRTSFEPYNSLLEDVYDIGASEVVDGLKQLAEHQRRGIMGKHIALRDATESLRKRAEELGLNETGDAESYRTEIQKSPELKQLYEVAQEKLNEAMTVRLFEITDVSSLPKSILSLLSVRPGEEPLSGLTGPNNEDLSPLSTDILHYKPFLEVDKRFYTFYHSGFEDRMAEIIEADLNQKRPAKRTTIEKIRSDYIEKKAVDLLSEIVNPSFVGRNLYYPNPDQEGHLTELDGLIEVDDVLMLVEVKSGGISAAASRGAPGSLEKDLKELIFEGQRQSERAERYIKSSAEVDFYDSTGKKSVHKVSHSKYRRIFRIVVTREQLGWVGADLAKLSVVDPSLSESMPWQVSLDDLWAIAELFEGKGIEFSHYLEVRLEAAVTPALSQQDEVDHIALYNAMNYYHKNVEGDADRMTFNAYGLEIDKYFMAKAADEELSKPEQKMPRELRLIIDALEKSHLSHRYDVGSFLLGNDGNQRKDVAKHIKKLLANQSTTGHRTVRLVSKDLALGISISQIAGERWEQEELRCALFMKKQDLKRWLSVQIKTDNGLSISQIVELKAEDYTEEQLNAAQARLERDLAQNMAKQKIAPNQQCPCGSGERFKNCHGKRNG
ncbi:MAG TPA: SEC-C domain-containing protein [Candidatus Saccharimonadales bacterium]|nr:SEC-C domain-containing protein [Candidatus Saccharimonadales bacterium]